MTMEELNYTDEGMLAASGPIDYKIPCVRNIPRQFNVKLMQNNEHVNTVYSAKVTPRSINDNLLDLQR